MRTRPGSQKATGHIVAKGQDRRKRPNVVEAIVRAGRDVKL